MPELKEICENYNNPQIKKMAYEDIKQIKNKLMLLNFSKTSKLQSF